MVMSDEELLRLLDKWSQCKEAGPEDNILLESKERWLTEEEIAKNKKGEDLVVKWAKTGLLDGKTTGNIHKAILIESQQCQLLDDSV